MQTNRDKVHVLVGDEPCIGCEHHDLCQAKAWACAAFFNYCSHGETHIKPAHPNRIWFGKLFSGIESPQVGKRERGESRRLNRTQVVEIRRMAEERLGYRHIGELFNISPSMVGQILHKDIYKDVV